MILGMPIITGSAAILIDAVYLEHHRDGFSVICASVINFKIDKDQTAQFEVDANSDLVWVRFGGLRIYEDNFYQLRRS